MKILYVDSLNSGISGDMFLAALLGIVKDPNEILSALETLKRYLDGVSQLEIELVTVERSGILLNQLKINMKENKHHRTPKMLQMALNTFLNENQYSQLAQTYAKNVLDSLFKAEASVHGKLVDNIHLHELSSVDTLIDILGVTKALENIGCFHEDFKVYCSRLPLGGGKVKTAHGMLAVPAPATAKILEHTEIIIQNGPIDGELVTPTGAALLVNLIPICKEYFDGFKLKNIGYSTGQKNFIDFPNVLRIFFGESKTEIINSYENVFQKYMEDVCVLETDVDDLSGEILGNFIKKMEEADILDIQVMPSITKKNRPSYVIRILCKPKMKFDIIEKMFREIGTLGVRMYTIKRVCIERKLEPVKLLIDEKPFIINYKISYVMKEKKIQIVNIKPEYEDLKKISYDTGYTIKEILLKTASEVTKLYNKKSDLNTLE